MNVFDRYHHLKHLIDARSADQLWQRLHQRLEGYGFDRILYGRSLRKPANGTFTVGDALVLSSYGAEFDSYFLDGRKYCSDVTTQWAMFSQGAVSWSLTQTLRRRGKLDAAELRVHRETRDLGIRSGYTVSVRNTDSALVAALGLCAQDGRSQDDVDRMWACQGDEVAEVVSLFDLCLHSKACVGAAEQLSDRQCEVLSWAGEGKTTEDIGESYAQKLVTA